MIGAKCNLQDRFAKKFLTLEGEQLVFATRQHASALFPAFAVSFFAAFGVAVFIILASIIFPNYLITFIIVGIIVMTIVLEILIKQMAEWFFHFYIVTNRKIVEVAYRPLYSKIIFEVLLDQVRCTEVDVKANGLSNEIFNVGTVLITFDRPTHEKIFTLEYIGEPRKAAMHLADTFGMQKNSDNADRWITNPAIRAII